MKVKENGRTAVDARSVRIAFGIEDIFRLGAVVAALSIWGWKIQSGQQSLASNVHDLSAKVDTTETRRQAGEFARNQMLVHMASIDSVLRSTGTAFVPRAEEAVNWAREAAFEAETNKRMDYMDAQVDSIIRSAHPRFTRPR